MNGGSVGVYNKNLDNYFGDQYSDLTLRENFTGVD